MYRTICYGLLAILSIYAYAQDNSTGEPTFLPPNAAAFGKYGDTPVNYHTGTTNISIPIFSITEGNLSLPISLSYHSGGIRVDEMSSWVGLGWSLNAGGVISRSVQGGLDEGNSKSGAVSNGAPWGWYRNMGAPPQITNFATECPYQFINPISGDSLAPSINQTYPSDGTSCYDYHYDAARGLIDTEPDIFSFNIGGYSGKFFFNPIQKLVMLEEQDIKVDVIYDATNMKFTRWQITTPDGVKYFFGDRPTGVDAIENTYSLTTGWPAANENYYSTSSWYLYRIESPNARHWIELEYEAEDYGFASRSSHSCQANADGALTGDCDTAPISRVKNRVQGVRLSKITTSSGRYEARFIVNATAANKRQDVSDEIGTNTAYPLSSIEIDDNYGWCKRFNLQTSYFQSTSSIHSGVTGYDTSDMKRLRLDGVQETDCNNTLSKPAHTFTYNSTPMGRRYALGRDHWGFYNGQDTQAGLIPDETISIGLWVPSGNTFARSGFSSVSSNGGANRTPNEIKMKAWSLERITYPTGGYTDFTFGSHEHNGQMVGGLRIEQISDYDENGQLAKRRSFTYHSSELYTEGDHYGTDLQADNTYVNNVIMGRQYGALFNSSPNTALKHNHGYHIGYTSVSVNHEDGSSQKFIYQNSPVFDFSGYYPVNPPEFKSSNGSIIQSEALDSAGSAVSLEQTTYDPLSFTSNYNITKISSVTGFRTINGTPPQMVPEQWNFKNIYNISSTALRLASTTQTRDGVSQTTTYTYGGFHQQPIEVSTTNSEGEILKTTTKFAPDLTTSMATNLRLRNQIVPLEQAQYSNNQLISKSNTYYSGSSIMNLSHIEAYPAGTEMIRTDVSFNSDDQFQSIQKENDIPVAYFWEGDKGISVAKFTNASPTDVFYTSFEEMGSGTFSTSESKTGFYYNSGNTVNLLALGAPNPASDLLLTYHYYENGEWHYKEVDYNSSTLTESGATRIDEIRIYPKGTLVESYQTGFGGQMISQTDNHGNTIRYELDNLGRLKYITDQDNNRLKEYHYNYAN